MRDAVTFEALGIPTIVLVNDVFEPIANATATLLRLPEDYVANNIVWLPHPTSNLSAAAAANLIDERIELVRNALVGRAPRGADAVAASAHQAGAARAASAARVESGALETARAEVRGLAQSLSADGADLILSTFSNGVLHGEVRIGDVTCDDGSCIMPTDSLERMLEAMLRGKIASLRGVTLREIKLPEG
jgi:hypothetical protein